MKQVGSIFPEKFACRYAKSANRDLRMNFVKYINEPAIIEAIDLAASNVSSLFTWIHPSEKGKIEGNDSLNPLLDQLCLSLRKHRMRAISKILLSKPRHYIQSRTGVLRSTGRFWGRVDGKICSLLKGCWKSKVRNQIVDLTEIFEQKQVKSERDEINISFSRSWMKTTVPWVRLQHLETLSATLKSWEI